LLLNLAQIHAASRLARGGPGEPPLIPLLAGAFLTSVWGATRIRLALRAREISTLLRLGLTLGDVRRALVLEGLLVGAAGGVLGTGLATLLELPHRPLLAPADQDAPVVEVATAANESPRPRPPPGWVLPWTLLGGAGALLGSRGLSGRASLERCRTGRA
jgi:hypothetical protein